MLENQIIPLYFAKNSKGYSPEWIQYIKGSIGDIAPHFTMKRMIDDYIDRFYNKEATRANALSANEFSLARQIVAWKEKVAAAWPGVKVVSLEKQTDYTSAVTGEAYKIIAKIDTNGLGEDLHLEQVIHSVRDGVDHFEGALQFKPVAQAGNVVTYELSAKLREAGVFRVGYRLYPWNENLPHRQDFAFTMWI